MALTLCRPEQESKHHLQPAKTDSLQLPAATSQVSYDSLYGFYFHESNGPAFRSELEIKPMGNDLQFNLTLQHPGCEWQLQGILAMMYHMANEYAGFYNSETCRLVFTFFPAAGQVRIEPAGICVTLPGRCQLGGVYLRLDS